MTAPTWQSTTVTDFGSDATTHNANMPASASSGDLLLALACFDSSSTTITTPSGWTLLLNGPVTMTDPVFAVYGKVADGTEGGTTVNWVTSNSQRGSVHVHRVQTGTWIGSLDGLRIGISSGNSVLTAITLAIGATTRDVLWILAQAKSSATAWGSTPSGYSNDNKTNVSEDSASSGSIASATKTSTAASESSAGWTGITASAIVLVAIRPVSDSNP